MYLQVDGELVSIDDGFAELFHYGVGHLDGGHSGRYPWGSGNTAFQHPRDFEAKYRELAIKYNGNKAAMAKEMGEIMHNPALTVSELAVMKSLARNRVRTEDINRAKELYSRYQNYTKVGELMGIPDNSVRSLLNSSREERTNQVEKTAQLLMQEVDKYKKDGVNGMIDVGKGVAQELGVSKTVLDNAIYACYLEGYERYQGGVKTGPGMQTTQVVLCSPGTEYKEIYDFKNVHTITEYHSNDGGESFKKLQPPVSIDSKRIQIRYAEEGGKDKDGVIELRRGVPDISLGGTSYAQVRIGVDNEYYLKGMAIYSDDMPDGVDIIFNTNKKQGTPMMNGEAGVLKPMKKTKDGSIDTDNPFGANIKSFRAGGQHYYIDPKTGEEKLSIINKVKDEGDWDSYSDSLASQFLSKQNRDLIKRQLDKTYSEKAEELNKIISYTNPTVKKQMLLTFADECDGAAVHLKAAALPRQSWQVILPSTSLKDNEIYAPNYRDGEKVALIRYPHGGVFEIPILTVNNSNTTMRKIYGQMKDAVAINSKVAETLSGADFDGDTADPDLRKLEDFDPKDYKIPYPNTKEGRKEAEAHGYKYMTEGYKQRQMGEVSNLITDMTLKGANNDEIVRAVKHSMVVIDAVKHGLDYQRSYKENGIRELKLRYQGHMNENGRISTGASTLISQAKSPFNIPERKGSSYIDKVWNEDTNRWEDAPEKTGTKGYKNSNREYYQIKIVNPDTGKKETRPVYEKKEMNPRTGKKEVVGYTFKDFDGKYKDVEDPTQVLKKDATTSIPKMLAVDDANELSSGTIKERLYANYANGMKQLAKDARLEYTNTHDIEYDKAARQIYKEEFDSLNEKLTRAQAKAPRERQAQRMANAVAKAKKDAAAEMSDGEYKKIKQRALEEARVELGIIGGEFGITITDKEWEAIQSGAIPKTTLTQILRYADDAQIKQLALPREGVQVTSSVSNKINGYWAQGKTAAQIADQLGISVSTVYKYLDKE